MLFLGIDVGGSKTHALICDLAGNVEGFGTAPGGNPEIVGYDGLAAAMQAALVQALKIKDINKSQITAAGFGIAGYDWPFQYEDTLGAVKSLGLSTDILAIENDAIPPILAGSHSGWGIAACVGTGNNVRGVDAQGHLGRITGNSATFGEYGGAGEIMQTALQRLTWMWTRRGPATQLAEVLVKDCGARDLGELIEGLVAERYHLKASQAPLVVATAEEGDKVAQEVLIWNAEELARSVLAVARQLELERKPFDVVMSGHLFKDSDIYRYAFIESVKISAAKAEFILSEAPPVVGAVLMAIQAARLGFEEARKALINVDFMNNT